MISHTALCPRELSLKYGRTLQDVLHARRFPTSKVNATLAYYYRTLGNFARDAALHFSRFCISSTPSSLSRLSQCLGFAENLQSLQTCISIYIDVLQRAHTPRKQVSCGDIPRKSETSKKPPVKSKEPEKPSDPGNEHTSDLSGVLPETLGVAALLGVQIDTLTQSVSTDQENQRIEQTLEMKKFSLNCGPAKRLKPSTMRILPQARIVQAIENNPEAVRALEEAQDFIEERSTQPPRVRADELNSSEPLEADPEPLPQFTPEWYEWKKRESTRRDAQESAYIRRLRQAAAVAEATRLAGGIQTRSKTKGKKGQAQTIADVNREMKRNSMPAAEYERWCQDEALRRAENRMKDHRRRNRKEAEKAPTNKRR